MIESYSAFIRFRPQLAPALLYSKRLALLSRTWRQRCLIRILSDDYSKVRGARCVCVLTVINLPLTIFHFPPSLPCIRCAWCHSFHIQLSESGRSHIVPVNKKRSSDNLCLRDAAQKTTLSISQVTRACVPWTALSTIYFF